ncbi:MAG: peptidoglycan DD-metalloendopeptidase family protein [Bacteroidales bacterium]|nr:peptidoglycan DD-metalloendopeptidase family protein [Bacteroidales bacterium]
MKKKYVPEVVFALITISLLFAVHFLAEKQVPNTLEPVTGDSSLTDTLSGYKPKMRYGIPVDSFMIYEDKIKRNDRLADILSEYGVDYQTIDLLARRSKPVFNVRKIKAGNNYSVICTNDSLEKVQYFVYENSPVDYIVFHLTDSVHVHRGEKEIKRRQMMASGKIETSLWVSMKNQNINPMLAVELSEIYAWTIDFFAIDQGDRYKVIYEELLVDGKSIGLGDVVAAWMKHRGEDFYAFRFRQNGVNDYFDDEAKNLRRAFLKAPLRYSRVSSGFSYNRMHPVLKYRRAHLGVDYAAPIGTPVHAIGDGVIIFAGRNGGAGRMVKIKHNGTYTTAYLHLYRYGKGIRKGKWVKQGDIIGYVGSSGLSTGPHLDFRFYRNGHAVNPLRVESPPVEPVKKEYQDQFEMIKDYLKKNLDDIPLNQPKQELVNE